MSGLSSKRVAILELDHDELRGGGPDVLGKMHVPIAAPERSTRNRGGRTRPVRKREVEGLIGEEDDATGGMSVHHRFLAGTVLDPKETNQLVLERYGVVGGIRPHGIWNGVGATLGHQRRRGDSEYQTEHQVSHADLFVTERGQHTAIVHTHVHPPLTSPRAGSGGRASEQDLRPRAARRQGNFDVYNVFNNSDIVTMNLRYGPTYLQPISILAGRLVKFSGQVDF